MSFSLAPAVDGLSFDTVIRRRIAPGVYGTDGVFIPGAETSATLSASVTPFPDRELEKLTNGERTRGGIRLILTGDLRTGDRAAGIKADRIDYRGEVYEVVKCGDWTTFSFLDVVAAKVEP